MEAIKIDGDQKLFCFNPILGYFMKMHFEFTLRIDTSISSSRTCLNTLENQRRYSMKT
jgi:hypothetical protein